MNTKRFRVEYYMTNPKRPAAIWDFETRDGDWWRLVAELSASKATIEEAEAMCQALNNLDDIKEKSKFIFRRLPEKLEGW